jgi:hypothetical protein
MADLSLLNLRDLVAARKSAPNTLRTWRYVRVKSANRSKANVDYLQAALLAADCCPSSLQWGLILPRESPHGAYGSMACIYHAGTTEDEG